MLVGLCAGCGLSSGNGQERYIPAAEKARASITSALQAWQRGDVVGEVRDTKPLVVVVDSFRRERQTLERFEILGEVAGLTQRSFLVKLSLANPTAEESVLWVYRHEDLELLTHWEHKMPPSPSEKQP
jgi:hypothetical protein